LKHVSGFKNYNDNYRKIPGPIAKYFSCVQPAFAYPIFKTLKPDKLTDISPLQIPVRLLQSAGNITNSRVTAFLEHILKPISIRFCQTFFNEYCRDSKQYLMDLAQRKTNFLERHPNTGQFLYIVAGDVKALYPSIARTLALIAIRYALTHFSDFNTNCIDTFIELISHCLNNVIVQHKNESFVQKQGIVTGDNYSVSIANITIANITLHYVLIPIAKTINCTQLFKRFVDDIVRLLVQAFRGIFRLCMLRIVFLILLWKMRIFSILVGAAIFWTT